MQPRKIELISWQRMFLAWVSACLAAMIVGCGPIYFTSASSKNNPGFSETPSALATPTPTGPTASPLAPTSTPAPPIQPPTPASITTLSDSLILATPTPASPLPTPSSSPRPQPLETESATPTPFLTPEQESPTMSATASPSLTVLEQKMVAAINQARRAQGLSPYQVDERLTALARAHAQDMAERDYFSHTTPEGKTLDDRFLAQGLTAPVYGENIQRNPQPIDQVAQAAFEEFMKSPPHRDNILSSQYDHIGVGVAADSPGWYIFVLIFAQQPQSILSPGGESEPQSELSVLSPTPTFTSSLETLTLTSPPSVNLAALEQEMVQAINAERQAHSLPPYQIDKQLRDVAQAHAQDLVKRGYMSHVTLEGKTYLDRLREAGLIPQRYGENIQLSVRPANEAVQDGLARWINDPAHRDNVLNPQYTHIGLGVAQTPEGWYVFVMDLMKR